MKVYAEIKKRTALNSVKLYVLYRFAKDAVRREGDVAELGVYRGGSARLLAEIFRSKAPQKKILLCDTFEGMPPSDAKEDIFITNDLSDTDYEKVKRYMGDFGNVVFYKGAFAETFPAIPNSIFSFVHVDCDLYGSVLECCDYFYPKMANGGVILFDDYGFLCAPGAKKAVENFFSNKPESPIPLPTGQCVVIRQR